MNSYTPNFSDPRVNKRIKTALGFACGVMSETKAQPWSTRYIDKYFGSQRNDLSKWLRNILLITENDRWNKDTGECKTYRLNVLGVNYLREVLKISDTQTHPIVVEVAKEYQNQLKTGQFEYIDKASRLWHPLQRYRRQYKQQILADNGYQHQYDIQCCAPTLIHQYSQKLGMDLYLFALNKYLTDRTAIRQQIADQIELPVEAVKEIINALFAGAVISKSDQCDIYKILNGDIARIEYLKQDPFITELRQDIKTCWQYITPYMSRRRNNKTNRLLPVNSRQKWFVYFDLERQVLNSVRNYLDEKKYRYFLEHDGWTCEVELNENELHDFVRNQTGFDLKFEYVKTSNTQTHPIVVEV